MLPKELLKRLKQFGAVDAETLAKIERQLADTRKKVSAKAVIRYLVEKNKISESDGKLLLDSSVENLENLAVSSGRRTGRQVESYDTDDLIGGHLQQPIPPKPSTPPAKPKRKVDRGETHEQIEHEEKGDFTVIDQPMGIDAEQLSNLSYQSAFDDLGTPGKPAEKKTPGFDGKLEKDNQWDSRWLFVGFSLVAILIMSTIGLAWLLNRSTADLALRKAEEYFANNQWQAAKEEFETFVRDFPQDTAVAHARALRVNCMLRGFYEANNFKETLAVAKVELPKLVEEPESAINEIYGELSVILPKTALSFSENALKAQTTTEKEEFLKLASDAEALVANSAFVPVSALKSGVAQEYMGQFHANMERVRYEINRENRYAEALKEMKQLTDESKTDAAAQKYYELVETYPLLRARGPLVEAITMVSAKEAELIKPAAFEIPVVTVEPPKPYSGSSVLVNVTGNNVPDLEGRVVTYVVNGVLYGLRAENGRILWWRPIALQTRIAPQWVDEPHRSDLIVCDQGSQQIMRLRRESGQLVWRIDVGEAFTKPALTKSKLFVTTLSGRIIRCNLDTGESELACQLPQGVTVGPTTNPDVALLYQIGQHSNLYLISQEDLSCREVFYLGHRPNSIDVEPFLMSGNLCVLENFAQHCRAHVLGFKERGAGVFPAQSPFKITDGKVTSDIYRYGRSVLVASETGDMQLYDLNVTSDGDETLFSLDPLIKGTFQTHPGLANYVGVGGGDLFLANRGLTKYRIKRADQSFDIRNTADTADIFLGPVYNFNNVTILLRRRVRSSQITASAVNSDTLEELWQSDFGAAPVDIGFEIGNRKYAVSNQGDLFDITDLAFDQPMIEPMVRGTTVAQNLRFDYGVELANGNRVYGALGDGERLLTYSPSDLSTNKLSMVESPANQVAAMPVGFGDALLIPSTQGQICRVNPITGALLGAPFQPPLNPNRPIQWVSPCVLESGDQFIAATTGGVIYHVQADPRRSMTRIADLDYGAVVKSSIQRVGAMVYLICRDANGDKLAAFQVTPNLTEKQTVVLPSDYAGVFQVVGSTLFVKTADEKLRAYDAELKPLWDIDLPPAKLVGPIGGDAEAIQLAFESGDLFRIQTDSGQVLNKRNLGFGAGSTPTQVGDHWVVSDVNGILFKISDETPPTQ